jgi:glycosyltransferase involved in cell wall biosynthesis
MRIYFEIGPLKEPEYTGIAQVTAALGEQLIGDDEVDSHFFFGRMVVPRPVVHDLLRRRNGDLLEWYLQRATLEMAPLDLAQPNVAVFPNRKTCRRGFSHECQIIHDLSTLLTPQFHHQDTIEYHATTMEDDILTNDITFCVSEATRSDILAYFPHVPPGAVHAMPLAASVDDLPGLGTLTKVERYILVLGTIEPRKNASQVLAYIRDHPGFLKQHRFVFLGRFGWGNTIEKLIEQYGLAGQYAAGRIVFAGFVTEHAKNLLLSHAMLVVYPSLFEGFGLPVLEAAALGIPCVTTRSSSLPEVGGQVCYYFDPFTSGDFDRALMTAMLDLQVRADAIRTSCMNWAGEFSWQKTYDNMKRRIMQLFAAAGVT